MATTTPVDVAVTSISTPVASPATVVTRSGGNTIIPPYAAVGVREVTGVAVRRWNGSAWNPLFVPRV